MSCKSIEEGAPPAPVDEQVGGDASEREEVESTGETSEETNGETTERSTDTEGDSPPSDNEEPEKKASYLDVEDDVLAPGSSTVLSGRGFTDLIEFGMLSVDGSVEGYLEFAEPDLGTALASYPYWAAGVMGGSPDAAMIPGWDFVGYGEWNIECWPYNQTVECGFRGREGICQVC